MAMLEKNPADRPSVERIMAVLREEAFGLT